jgi:cell division protein FtsB
MSNATDLAQRLQKAKKILQSDLAECENPDYEPKLNLAIEAVGQAAAELNRLATRVAELEAEIAKLHISTMPLQANEALGVTFMPITDARARKTRTHDL